MAHGKKSNLEVDQLRTDLVQMQVALKKAPFSVLVIIAGVEASGKGDAVNTLNTWLDPRGIDSHAFHEPSDEERERPTMWRFWRSLPRKGRVGIHIGSWYTDVFENTPRTARQRADFDRALAHISRVEQLLSRGGMLIVKCWLSLSRDAQRKRLRQLESDPDTSWRVSPGDWDANKHYSQRARWTERILKLTNQHACPWEVIDATSPHQRDVSIGRHILEQFHAHTSKHPRKPATRARVAASPIRPSGVKSLRHIQLDRKLGANQYYAKIDKWLGRLNGIVRRAKLRKRAVVWVFEGWDAAGKGGAIRRLAEAIDARDFRVIPVSKPTEEEANYHYLWRFWRHVPRCGLVTIYDRSWYGRVLVERIERFATEPEWRRAFDEINEFESELTEFGVIVIKFWLHISKDEQLRRFQDRAQTRYKQHKMEPEDWRNRRRWADYEVAVGDMVSLTDKSNAPWHVVPANNKRHARLKIIKTSCKLIEQALRKKT